MTGQDAVNTAKTFNDRLNFDGVILTKLDGDTRGGAAISIKSVVNKPIRGLNKAMSEISTTISNLNIVSENLSKILIKQESNINQTFENLADTSVSLNHYSNEGKCSWYDFAKEIVSISGAKCNISPINTIF